MLGCLVADWKCRHIGETERRAAEAAALYTADISCRRAAVGESNDYDEVKTSQQAHVEEAVGLHHQHLPPPDAR